MSRRALKRNKCSVFKFLCWKLKGSKFQILKSSTSVSQFYLRRKKLTRLKWDCHNNNGNGSQGRNSIMYHFRNFSMRIKFSKSSSELQASLRQTDRIKVDYDKMLDFFVRFDCISQECRICRASDIWLRYRNELKNISQNIWNNIEMMNFPLRHTIKLLFGMKDSRQKSKILMFMLSPVSVVRSKVRESQNSWIGSQ